MRSRPVHIHRPAALKGHLSQLTGGVTAGSVGLAAEKDSGWRHGRELFSCEGRRLRPASFVVQKKRDSSWSPASRNRHSHMDGHTERAKANRYFLALPTTALAPSSPRPRSKRMPNGDPVASNFWDCGAGLGAGRAWCVTGGTTAGAPVSRHPPIPSTKSNVWLPLSCST